MPITPGTTVEIPVAELAKLNEAAARLAQTEASIAAERQAVEARELIRKGEHEQLIRSQQRAVEEASSRAATFAAQSALATALASQSLVPGGAAQLAELLKGKVVADPAGAAGFTVRSLDYRDVNTFVQAELSKPEYQHFRADRQAAAPAKPAAPVHPAAVQPSPAGTAPDAPADQPRNLGEALVRQHRDTRERSLPAGHLAAQGGFKPPRGGLFSR
jgi:hypothetical protein